MNRVNKLYRIFGWVKVLGLWISGISLMGMMIFIVVDVVFRNVSSNSINGAFEIVQNYFMPLSVFPALAYVYSSGVLPKMDLIIEKLNNQMKKVIIFSRVIIEIFILALMFQFTWDYAMYGLERKMSFPASGTMYIVYPLFFLIPISFALIIIENVFILIKNIMEKHPSFLFKEEK
ncbi:TRAP transporter small permease [Aeribacillus alveayuensis]|uniref:TRAP-type C4-dicarboxylate transport system permease small subunit n=1 Tax=Aeribacillus alveayuensis TaxID=279215 RepID=A0ABT9VRI4_9BACI|nr:TRAP-type C4-dicarboxylate transport system permease small subunit [Bacillus alveayuensis]